VYVAEDIAVDDSPRDSDVHSTVLLKRGERRDGDCHWNNSYGVVIAPVVRSMIDALYNITAIRQDPAAKGPSIGKQA
jgi:hypothetical protein